MTEKMLNGVKHQLKQSLIKNGDLLMMSLMWRNYRYRYYRNYRGTILSLGY